MAETVVVMMVLMAMTAPGLPGLSPQTLYHLGLRDNPPPPCRELTPEELNEQTRRPGGKGTGWSFVGEYHCERTIFEYGERNSFIDHVTKYAPKRARKAVVTLSRLLLSHGRSAANLTWSVAVNEDDPRIRHYLRHLFVQELAEQLGDGRVTRRPAPNGAHQGQVKVSVRRTLDPDLLLKIEADWDQTTNHQVWVL